MPLNTAFISRNGRKGTLNIYFVLTFKEAVRTDRKITLLKIAASDGKLGVLDVDPASVMAIRETEEPVLECNLGCTPSHSIESLGNVVCLFVKYCGTRK